MIKTSTGSGTTDTYGEINDIGIAMTHPIICVKMDGINMFGIPYSHSQKTNWSLQVYNIVSGKYSGQSVSWTIWYI